MGFDVTVMMIDNRTTAFGKRFPNARGWTIGRSISFTATATAFWDARSSLSISHLSSAYYWVVQDTNLN